MPNRPPVRVPVPASDVNYPAGVFPWSGTPTKIDQGEAAEAAGLVPAEPIPAQYQNFEKNAVGKYLEWIKRGPFETMVKSIALANTSSQATPTGVCWCPATNYFHFSGGQDGTDSCVTAIVPNGADTYLIDVNCPNGDAGIDWIISSYHISHLLPDYTDRLLVGGSSDPAQLGWLAVLNDTTWSEFAGPFASDGAFTGGVHDFVNRVFVVVGWDDNLSEPRIYVSDDDITITAWASATTVPATSGTQIHLVAINTESGRIVTLTNEGESMYSDDADVFVLGDQLSGGTNEPHGLTWSPRWGFVATSDEGVYQSGDGDTWVRVDTLPDAVLALFGSSGNRGSLVAIGYDVLVCGWNGNWLTFSYDGGATWVGQRMNNLAASVRRIAVGNGQIAIAQGTIAAGVAHLSASCGVSYDIGAGDFLGHVNL